MSIFEFEPELGTISVETQYNIESESIDSISNKKNALEPKNRDSLLPIHLCFEPSLGPLVSRVFACPSKELPSNQSCGDGAYSDHYWGGHVFRTMLKRFG